MSVKYQNKQSYDNKLSLGTKINLTQSDGDKHIVSSFYSYGEKKNIRFANSAAVKTGESSFIKELISLLSSIK